jgi:hypothetical protein
MFYLSCLFFSIASCQCKKHLSPFNGDKPVLYKRYLSYFSISPSTEIEIGSRAPTPKKYTLPDKSTKEGYTMRLYLQKDSTIIVGKDSEFRIEKKKYKVIRVIPKFYWIDGIQQNISQGIYLQLLETPKYCKCQNKKLKAFDEQLKYMDIDSLLAE